jgi:hypothetical protein
LPCSAVGVNVGVSVGEKLGESVGVEDGTSVGVLDCSSISDDGVKVGAADDCAVG